MTKRKRNFLSFGAGAASQAALAATAALAAAAVGRAQSAGELLNIAGTAGVLALPTVALPMAAYLYLKRHKADNNLRPTGLPFLAGALLIFVASSIVSMTTSAHLADYADDRALLRSHIEDRDNTGCQRITLV